MENNLKNSEIMEELIDRNTVETLENEYWEHIEYSENINTLIYCGRTISVLVVTVIAIILFINKIKNKKVNKVMLIFFIIFIIITVFTFFVQEIPV